MFRPQMFHRIALLIVLIGNSMGCSVPDTTPIQQWRHVEEGAYAADISTDGTLAVVSGVNNGVNVWRIGQSDPLYHWSHQGEGDNLVMSVHISADKSYVVTADREAFALWSLETGEPEGFWRIDESSIRDVVVTNNGNGILVARSNGKVMYFEPRTSRRLEFLGHQEKVYSIDISPNGKFASTGGNGFGNFRAGNHYWDKLGRQRGATGGNGFANFRAENHHWDRLGRQRSNRRQWLC